MRKLSSQIFIAPAGDPDRDDAGRVRAVRVHDERGQLDKDYEARAASIAADRGRRCPTIRAAWRTGGRPCAAIDPDASPAAIRRSTGASYVVVIDMNRVRHSHPIPPLIGQRVTEPIVTADGRVHRRHRQRQHRSFRERQGAALRRRRHDGRRGLGRASGRARSPARSWHELPSYAALVRDRAGRSGRSPPWLLAQHLKRRTFGLELDEIAQLLQEREATLHGIREGVIAFDPAGRGHRRQRRGPSAARSASPVTGRLTLDDVLPRGRLRDVLAGASGGQDDVVLTDDFCLVINRMPVDAARAAARRRRHAARPHRDGGPAARARRRARAHRVAARPAARVRQPAARRRRPARARPARRGAELSAEIQGTAAEFDNSLRAQHRLAADRRSAARQGGRGERARYRARPSPTTPGSSESPGRRSRR